MNTIKTILFDMGNVLVDFTPNRFCAEVSDDLKEIEHLSNGIFYTKAWLDLDEGLISEDEALFEILKNFDLDEHEKVKKIFNSWDEWMHEKQGMNEIIKNLKEKGYQLILASNAALRYHRYIHRIKIFSYFDEIVYSCDIKCLKPDLKFFKHILETYHLNPKETFYIDDSYANIKSAQELSILTYHFIGDVESFKETLNQTKIL